MLKASDVKNIKIHLKGTFLAKGWKKLFQIQTFLVVILMDNDTLNRLIYFKLLQLYSWISPTMVAVASGGIRPSDKTLATSTAGTPFSQIDFSRNIT